MLKKAGIVVAAAAAGLLAVSPLAFADDYRGGDSYSYDEDYNESYSKSYDEQNFANNSGNGNDILNVEGNNVNAPLAVCGNDVPVNVLGVQVFDVVADLTGAVGILADDTEADSRNGETGDDRSCRQSIENNNGHGEGGRDYYEGDHHEGDYDEEYDYSGK